eukprot:Clim_evm68s215 gene=Clim_evmTU68s215
MSNNNASGSRPSLKHEPAAFPSLFKPGHIHQSKPGNNSNTMERRRRLNMRSSFDNLRSVVPDLDDFAKPSTIQILRTAAQYITRITFKFQEMQRHAAQLHEEHDRLEDQYLRMCKKAGVRPQQAPQFQPPMPITEVTDGMHSMQMRDSAGSAAAAAMIYAQNGNFRDSNASTISNNSSLGGSFSGAPVPQVPGLTPEQMAHLSPQQKAHILHQQRQQIQAAALRSQQRRHILNQHLHHHMAGAIDGGIPLSQDGFPLGQPLPKNMSANAKEQQQNGAPGNGSNGNAPAQASGQQKQPVNTSGQPGAAGQQRGSVGDGLNMPLVSQARTPMQMAMHLNGAGALMSAASLEKLNIAADEMDTSSAIGADGLVQPFMPNFTRTNELSVGLPLGDVKLSKLNGSNDNMKPNELGSLSNLFKLSDSRTSLFSPRLLLKTGMTPRSPKGALTITGLTPRDGMPSIAGMDVHFDFSTPRGQKVASTLGSNGSLGPKRDSMLNIESFFSKDAAKTNNLPTTSTRS